VYRSDVFPKVFFKYTHLKDKEHLFNQSHGSCFNAFRGVVLVKTIS